MKNVAARIWNALSLARNTTTVDDSGPVQQVQLKHNELETYDRSKVVHHYGFSSSPPVGSDFVVVFGNGNRSNGFAVASNHQQHRYTGLKAGEIVIFDDKGQSLLFTSDNNGPKVVLTTPRLEVTGDVIDRTVNGPTNNLTLQQTRDVYNSHTHNDPQGGVVSPPNQQEK